MFDMTISWAANLEAAAAAVARKTAQNFRHEFMSLVDVNLIIEVHPPTFHINMFSPKTFSKCKNLFEKY